jgi:hypothetical protein
MTLHGRKPLACGRVRHCGPVQAKALLLRIRESAQHGVLLVSESEHDARMNLALASSTSWEP